MSAPYVNVPGGATRVAIAGAPPGPHDMASLCFHDGTLYLLSGGLFRMENNSWRQMPLVPFCAREGQSMTSTKHGIVFFGGRSGSVFYNDLWIYNQKSWSYIVTPITPRAFHAAATDSADNLIIVGGEKEKIFGDSYTIDLRTKETKKIEFEVPVDFSHHTLTYLPDLERYSLLGGEQGLARSKNSKILILDTKTGEVCVSESEFRTTSVMNHHVTYAYQLLFVTGGKINGVESSYVWMYHFGHRVWIPMDLKEELKELKDEMKDFQPLFLFTTMETSRHNEAHLHVVDSTVSRMASCTVFTSKTDVFDQDNPQYIEFLRRNLVNAKTIFEQMESGESKECRSIQDDISKMVFHMTDQILKFELLKREELDMTTKLRAEFEQIQLALVEAYSIKQSMKRVAQDEQSNSAGYDIAKSVDELIECIKTRSAKRKDFVKKAEKQADTIELLTFRRSLSMKPTVGRSMKTHEHSLLLSQQLADRIQILKKECKELTDTFEVEESKLDNCEARILSLYRQLAEAAAIKNKLKAQLFETKKSTFATYHKVIMAKEADLQLGMSSEANEQRQRAVKALNGALEHDHLKKLIEQKETLLRQLLELSNKLRGEGRNVKKVINIVQSLSKWSEEAWKNCSSMGNLKPLVLATTQPKEKREKGKKVHRRSTVGDVRIESSFAPFLTSVGKLDLFVNDLATLVHLIKKEL